MPADLVLLDGKILTQNPAQPHAEAAAIQDDKIIYVGTSLEAKKTITKETKVVDLKGKTVLPGFIDTHVHVCDFAAVLAWLDLSSIESIEEIQALIQARASKTPKGKWIIGRGWNPDKLGKRLPTRFDLDAVSPHNPVILYQNAGQMCLANTQALQIAGLTKQSVSTGGVDVDGQTGEPIGLLHEEATTIVWKFVPPPTEEELLETVVLACQKISAAGITSICWIALSASEVLLIEKLNAQNRLPLNVYVVIPIDLLEQVLTSPLAKASSKKAAKLIGVVIFTDGYLSSQTAAVSQPYCGSSNLGKMLYTPQELCRLALKVRKAGLQLILHAAGDKAVDTALSVIEQTAKETPKNVFRDRIEHAAILNPQLIERMKNAGVLVSVQPLVIDSEFRVYSAVDRLGSQRVLMLYPLKTLTEQGIRVAGGSDCPMEPLNPLLGIQALATREFISEQQLTLEQALRCYTLDAAYAFSEENSLGSIEVNKQADLNVLSGDLFATAPADISKIEVEMTVIKGNVVFSKH